MGAMCPRRCCARRASWHEEVWEAWKALKAAMARGDLPAVQRHHRAWPQRSSELFRLACGSGHMHIATWVYTNAGVELRDCLGPALDLVCENGHLHMAKWLLGLGQVWPDHDDCGFAFLRACLYGRVEMAQWLRATAPQATARMVVHAFQAACGGGHLPMAKWLLAQGGVDIHVRQCAPFRYACAGAHLAVAQWLVSLGGMDVHAADQKLVRRLGGCWTLGPNHQEFLRWLLSLDFREDDAGWPPAMVAAVRTWSPARDVWIRSVVEGPRPLLQVSRKRTTLLRRH
jgi:hypothetical protein